MPVTNNENQKKKKIKKNDNYGGILNFRMNYFEKKVFPKPVLYILS